MRTFEITKSMSGPSCGDSLDDSNTSGTGTWEVAVGGGAVHLTASGPFGTTYYDNTFSAGNPSTTPAAGEFPAIVSLAEITASAAGAPCTCYGQQAALKATETSDEIAAFFAAP